MRLAVVSDIHSNLQALEAVFGEIEARGVDGVYCLGDVVGYGADPGPCLELVRERCAGVVKGNHDAAVVNLAEEWALPREGQTAARHNRTALSKDQLAYLAALPLRLEAEGCTFVHASPEDPGAWRRIGAFSVTRRQFDHFDTDLCFVGHTHVPGMLADRVGTFTLRRGRRYLINPGSVGQPRDGNPKASFGIVDTEAFTWDAVRVEYDVEKAAQRILKEGLPDVLAARLRVGR